MRFFVLTVLSVLALALVATGGVAAHSPQPTIPNGTATPNATATTTPTASTPAPTSSATTTPTPDRTADDVLDEVDPRNATHDDVQTVADWLRSEGADRGGDRADRAREWLGDATADRNITLPNLSLGQNGTATPTPMPTEPPAPESDGNATRIDSVTWITASEYFPKKDVVHITIRSEIVQTVTLADAGLFADGGEIQPRNVALDAGETATIEMPVTKRNGRVGVGIGTENTFLYAHIVKQGGGGLDVIRELGGLQALIIGVVVAFTWMLIAGWNELRGEKGRPVVA